MIISYDYEAKNTERVAGHGFMAGKPAASLKPGDVFYSFVGTKRTATSVVRDGDLVLIGVGAVGGKIIKRDYDTIIPVEWESPEQAARYGHTGAIPMREAIEEFGMV